MNYSLEIAYLLLTSKRPLNTSEIMERVGCDRKTVYHSIDRLELAGFITDVQMKDRHSGNYYSLSLSCDGGRWSY